MGAVPVSPLESSHWHFRFDSPRFVSDGPHGPLVQPVSTRADNGIYCTTLTCSLFQEVLATAPLSPGRIPGLPPFVQRIGFAAILGGAGYAVTQDPENGIGIATGMSHCCSPNLSPF